MEPYAPRTIQFCGLREGDGWKIKLYSVVYGDTSMDWDGFETGLRLAQVSLPEPNPERGRPGLGFLIAHQGRTGDYVVLCWWDRENELPVRVWVRSSREEPWHLAQNSESFCVWDLEIMWAERNAWVQTMLAAGGSDAGAYLSGVESRYLRT